MAAEPEPGLVSSFRCPVEPLVHAPEGVHSTGEGRVRVVDDSVLERERAYPRRLPRIGRRVGSAHGCELREPTARAFEDRLRVHRAIVVFDAPLALLLLGDRHVEIEVEVAAERGRPWEAPAHAALVGLELVKRRAGDGPNRHVVVLEVDGRAVEPVRDRRTRRAARGVLGPEHEVVHEELSAPTEQIRKRRASFVDLEAVVLVDSDPGELLPPPGELVAAPSQLLLGLEQLEPGHKPLLTRSCRVLSHRIPPYAPGARYWTCSALRRASIVSSTVRRTVVSNELSAPPPPIASATAAMDTLSGASQRL